MTNNCAHRWIGLLLLLVAAAAGSGFRPHDFIMEDRAMFSHPTMRSIKYIPYHFSNDLKLGSTYYRPMQNAVMTLTYAAFGRNYGLYHSLNLFFLWACAFLLYFLVLEIFDQPIAILAAVFFAAHPANVPAENFVSSICYLLADALMVAAIFILVKAFKNRFLAVFCVFCSNLFFLVVLLCHEFTIMLPFYAAVILYLSKGSPRRKFFLAGSLLVTCALYLVFRFKITALRHDIFPHQSIHFISLEQYFASLGHVLSWYLSHLVYPAGIVSIWVKKIHGGWLWAMVPVLIMGALLTSLVVSLRRGHKAFFLGLAWLAIAMAPVFLGICFIKPRYAIIEQHWMVFALMGFCVMLAALVVKLKKKPLIMAAVFVVASLWITADRIYNSIWSDEKLYCHFWFNHCPEFALPLQFLSRIYAESGDANMSMYYLARTLAIDGRPIENSYDAADLALKQGNYQLAKKYYDKFYLVNPDNILVLRNLGILAMVDKDEPRAKVFFEKASKDRFEVIARLNLALIYKKNNDLASSVRLLSEILSVEPGHEAALVELIQIYMQRQDRANAVKTAKALSKYSRNPQVLKNAAWILEKYGKFR